MAAKLPPVIDTMPRGRQLDRSIARAFVNIFERELTAAGFIAPYARSANDGAANEPAKRRPRRRARGRA